MKAFTLFFWLLFSVSVFGQFPEPTNFQFNYSYILLNSVGPCNGHTIVGPAYCSDFWWEAPDTTSTSATLDHYVIYYHPNNDPQIYAIATTTDTSVEMEIGIIGQVWVTAVYNNPDGESAASNVVVNNDLPISVGQISEKDMTSAYYDKTNEILNIKISDKTFQIKLYNYLGELLQDVYNTKQLNMATYAKGLYIVEIILKNHRVVRYKIIK